MSVADHLSVADHIAIHQQGWAVKHDHSVDYRSPKISGTWDFLVIRVSIVGGLIVHVLYILSFYTYMHAYIELYRIQT